VRATFKLGSGVMTGVVSNKRNLMG